MDALIAVQGQEDPTERRRRSLRRGHDLLHSLDRLKAALLSGRVQARELQDLGRQLVGHRSDSGDSGLDEVVAHIGLRAQVELAKLGKAPRAAATAAQKARFAVKPDALQLLRLSVRVPAGRAPRRRLVSRFRPSLRLPLILALSLPSTVTGTGGSFPSSRPRSS